MILILPAIFGLTLIGEGISKITHEEGNGILNIFFGLIFIGIVVFAYFFFSTYLDQRV
jgi:hypothetical protein